MADGQDTAQFADMDTVLSERRAKREAPAGPVEDTDDGAEIAAVEDEIESAPQAEETAEEEPAEANLTGEDDQEQPEPEEVIEAPEFWDKSGKEMFAKLSTEARKAVAAYEKQRTAAVARAMNEAAQVRKAAEAKQTQFERRIEELGEFVSQTEAELKQYEEIDWALEYAQARDQTEIDNVRAHQAHFASLKAARDKASKAQEQATQAQYHQFVTTEREVLARINPELDLKKPEGRERVGKVYKFLADEGMDPDTLNWIPAVGINLAYDAMRYRASKAKLQAAVKPSQKPPAGPSSAPAGAAESGSPSNKRLSQLQGKRSLSTNEYLEQRKLQRAKRK